jgi:predicted HicB family RNase H-like nuclease
LFKAKPPEQKEKPMSAEKTARKSVAVSLATHRRLKMQAAKKGVSIAQLIEEMMGKRS